MCRLRLFFRRASLQYKSDKVRRQLLQYYSFTVIIHEFQGAWLYFVVRGIQF